MWLNLQIGDVIFPMVGIPEWSLSLIIMIGIMGFPLVLILSWAFQITPDGIVLDTDKTTLTTDSKVDSQLDIGVNLLLLLSSWVLSALLVLQFTGDDHAAQAPAQESKGYILTELSLEAAHKKSLDSALATAITAEIRSQLIARDHLPLLPPGVGIGPDDTRTKLSLIGSVIVDGNTARMLAQLVNASEGVFVTAVAFSIEFDSILDAELQISERLVKTLVRFARPSAVAPTGPSDESIPPILTKSKAAAEARLTRT